MITCVDSDCIIYLVEQNPQWYSQVVARLAALRSTGHDIAMSELVRTECLAGPLHKGDGPMVTNFQVFFAASNIRILPLTTAVCERAAHLRAATNFKIKVPDCLHLAAAIEHGCTLFLTHDAQLKQCTAITVEILVLPG